MSEFVPFMPLAQEHVIETVQGVKSRDQHVTRGARRLKSRDQHPEEAARSPPVAEPPASRPERICTLVAWAFLAATPLFRAPVVARDPAAPNQRGQFVDARASSACAAEIDAAARVQAQVPQTICRETAAVAAAASFRMRW